MEPVGTNTRATIGPREYMILDFLKLMAAAIVTLVLQALLVLAIPDSARYIIATSVCFLSVITFNYLMAKYVRRGKNMGKLSGKLFFYYFVVNGQRMWHHPSAIDIAEAVYIISHLAVSLLNVVCIPRSMTVALGIAIALASIVVMTVFIDCVVWGCWSKDVVVIIRCEDNVTYEVQTRYNMGRVECDCRHCYPSSAQRS